MQQEIVSVDLTGNPKQYSYFLEVVKACRGITQYRKFAYGGAIRGGKTFVTLWILLWLCKEYPGSRWVVVRNDFPNLQKTTIESLKKILLHSKKWRWNQDKGNFYVQNDLGSRIYFMAENITRDPDLQDFLGLECNGFFFEQLEEFNRKTWDIGSSRAGSWYIDPMPPAFIFTTFNPTQRWPKQFIWERSINGTLPADFYYQSATPADNPFVTQDQWNTWGQMDDRYQRQFIGGDWTDFDDTDPRWAYAFSEAKHVKPTLPFMPSFPVYLTWDFNRDPLTCTAFQRSESIGTKNSFHHWLKEFKEAVQLQEMCHRIKTTFPNSIFFVTGDVSGKKGDIGYNERNATHYRIIQSLLRLNDEQMHMNDYNLVHNDSRLLVNTMLNMYPNFHFSKEGCPNLIHEYKFAKVDVNHKDAGHLLKDREDNQLDLFDGSRYAIQKYYKKYIDMVFLNQTAANQ